VFSHLGGVKIDVCGLGEKAPRPPPPKLKGFHLGADMDDMTRPLKSHVLDITSVI